MTRVALCIPCHAAPTADFTFSLARLVAASLKAAPELEIETLIARNSILVQSRTRLFEWAREWRADRILWLDADHSFPPQALLKLLLRRAPFVAANYPRRHAERTPSAVRRGEAGEWQFVATTQEKAARDELETVDRVGLGFALMDVTTIVRALGDPLYPLFETRSLPDGNFVGEDALFCDRLRAAGVPIHVDHALSWQMGHQHEITLSFRDET